MSSNDVHFNGHLPLSGLSGFVMEGPSSSEDYVTNGVEERVGRRIIMPDEGVEAVSYTHLTLPTTMWV